jgi:glycosyltransferase involved in cell wall biosynthesis
MPDSGHRHPVPVAILVGSLGVGGSERQMYMFLQACDRTRWTPFVFHGDDGERDWAEPIRALGIEVTELRGSPARKLLTLRRHLVRLGAGTFVSWSSFTNPYAWALLGLDVPAVGSYRNALFADLTPRLRSLQAWAGAARLHTLIANSAETASALKVRARGRVLLVPNAVEQPAAPEAARSEWRRRLRCTDDEFLVLGIGRLAPQKNYYRFIDTIAQAALRVPTLRAVVLGDDIHGFQADYEQYARAKGLSNERFTFAGGVPSGAEAVCAADVLLLTSDHEGMPNVVLEAMAGGVASVTTRVNGVTSVLTDGHDGFVVDHDAHALAEAVVRLAQDANLRREMGQRARRKVTDASSPRAVYEPLWELLPIGNSAGATRNRLRDNAGTTRVPPTVDASPAQRFSLRENGDHR